MAHSGNNLLDTFHNLGINTGNVSKLTIESWFDTDCEDTKKLLEWICTSLGKENVLTAHENDSYEHLLEDKLLLTGKPYEGALEQLQGEYSGILDYGNNLSKIQCMENELEVLLEEESCVEQQLIFNEKLSKKLSKEAKKLNEAELKAALKKKEAENKCLELSNKLDQAHEKLQSQIDRYAEHLNEYEHAAKPMFVSNVPVKLYRQYYIDITSYLSTFLRKEHEIFFRADASVRKIQNNTQSLDITTNQQEVLRKRIVESMHNYVSKQLKEEMLQAELQFLQGLDLNEIVSTGCHNNDVLLEANILSKEELLQCVYSDLENITSKVCDRHVDNPQISIIENNICRKQKKLELLTQLDDKVTEILAKHVLLFLFIEREKVDIQSTDKFFRDVHYYITHNLQNCQNRFESMIETINDYRNYNSLPLEQKFKIIDVLKTLVTNGHSDNNDNMTAIDALTSFRHEQEKLEQKIFFNDYEENRRNLLQIEQDIEVMWKFLCGGPTKRIIAIPKQLSDSFNNIDELQEMQKTFIKSSMQLVENAEKRMSNKWFHMKRLLWVWFLCQPEKVLRIIDQIECAVKQKRNEA